MKGRLLQPVQWKSRQRRRKGHPAVTKTLINALVCLHNGAVQGHPFVDLSGTDARVLRTLESEDLAFASKGFDGIRHKITGRGEQLLAVYYPPRRRDDYICPRCSQKPRRTRATGVRAPYCGQCEREINREKLARGIGGARGQRLCSACKTRLNHQFSGGKYSTYCAECLREFKRAEKRRRLDSLRARADAGEMVQCCRRGCQNPIHITPKTTYDVCEAHIRAYTAQYNDRRRPDSQAARKRRYANRLGGSKQ